MYKEACLAPLQKVWLCVWGIKTEEWQAILCTCPCDSLGNRALITQGGLASQFTWDRAVRTRESYIFFSVGPFFHIYPSFEPH